MKAVIQRVIDASVSVDGAVKGSISHGLLVYLGVAHDDSEADADWLAEKTLNLRIFNDDEDKMNLSLHNILNNDDVNLAKNMVNNSGVNQTENKVNGVLVNHEKNQVNTAPVGVLAISQFTLLGDARKGRRPSWAKAAPPEKARDLYLYFIKKIREQAPCEAGEFQAHMQVSYTNDGPVTILLDSEIAR